MQELSRVEEETVEAFNHLVALERDMIAALLALRSRLQRDDRGQVDQLLTEHADRLPVLEQQVRELGGRPPDPGQRPGELPRDASDIRVAGEDGDALRQLADDHEALAEAYRGALTLPHEDERARRILEVFASEMEQHSARLAALLPVIEPQI